VENDVAGEEEEGVEQILEEKVYVFEAEVCVSEDRAVMGADPSCV
jgi:hypothetical protein